MVEYVYLDNSNLFIEGQRLAAVKNGLASDLQDAFVNRTLDFSFRVDFGKLLEFVAGNDPSEIADAYLYGSRPPANDAIWGLAERAGFTPVVVDRNASNREKKVDTALVTQLMADAFLKGNKDDDTFTIVAGDGDYVPTVTTLVEQGFTVEVVFWGHASRELKTVCSRFIDLDQHFSAIKG